MFSQSSFDESSNYNNSMLNGGDMTSWLESLEAFEEPEDDYFKIDDYPLKRRQRRERLHSLHCYVARSGAEAIAVSASMFTRQVESMTRVEGKAHVSCKQNDDVFGPPGLGATFTGIAQNFKNSLGRATGGVAAQIGELYTSLANAIGEPPQRGVLARSREEQDAPLLLFWAINLCVLFTIAGLILFIVAFWTATNTDAEIEAADLVQPPLPTPPPLPHNSRMGADADKRNWEGIFRVLGVISLSLVSGCGLGLRHPLQSALLCGS
jgi:hypothetical protein